MSRLSGLARFLVVLAVVATLQATGVREASADASGCSLFSGGLAGKNPTDNLPECLAGGRGCYECAYSHTNRSGYDICAEDTDGIEDCTLNVSNFPDWWPDPDPGLPAPDPAPSGDNPDNGNGTGDDGGGVDLGDGGGDGGNGGPYYYSTPITYLPPSYLYSPPYRRPYHP